MNRSLQSLEPSRCDGGVEISKCEWSTVAYVLCILLLLSRQASAAQPPTLEDVANGVEAAQEQFLQRSNAFEIVYARVQSKDITPTEKSGGQFLARWHIARNGPDQWFSQTTIQQSSSTKGVSLSTQPITIMVKDRMFLEWRGGRNDCFIDWQNKSTDFFRGWHYLQYLGFDPYRTIASQTGLDWAELVSYLARFNDPLLKEFDEPYIVTCLRQDASHYEIHETPDIVGDVECWIVERPGIHKFWVDPSHGFAIRKRIVHWGPGMPRKREIRCFDLREVKPGLWLPYRVVVDHYVKVSVEPKSIWGSVANRSVYDVEEIVFDRNLDDLFEVMLPAGIMVNDFARDVTYRVPPQGGAPFDGPLEMSEEQLKKTRNWPLLIGNLVLTLSLLTLLIMRLRGMRKAAIILLITGFGVDVDAQDLDEQSTRAKVTAERVKDANGFRSDSSDAAAGETWTSWMPYWRARNDCGPNALFVLLRLLQKDVTTKQINELLQIDPITGCSMHDISLAATALGVRNEVRFVSNDNFRKVKFPVILHGNRSLKNPAGHFTVIVGRDPNDGRYAVIDTVSEKFAWYHEKSVLYGYSGYVLVPKESSKAQAWTAIVAMTLLVVVVCSSVVTVRLRLPRETTAKGTRRRSHARLPSV